MSQQRLPRPRFFDNILIRVSKLRFESMSFIFLVLFSKNSKMYIHFNEHVAPGVRPILKSQEIQMFPGSKPEIVGFTAFSESS